MKFKLIFIFCLFSTFILAVQLNDSITNNGLDDKEETTVSDKNGLCEQTHNTQFINGKHYRYSYANHYCPLEKIDKEIIDEALDELQNSFPEESVELFQQIIRKRVYEGCCMGACVFFLAHPDKTDWTRDEKKMVVKFQAFEMLKIHLLSGLNSKENTDLMSFLEDWDDEIESYFSKSRDQKCLRPLCRTSHPSLGEAHFKMNEKRGEIDCDEIADKLLDYYKKGCVEFIILFGFELTRTSEQKGHAVLAQFNKKRIVDASSGIFYYEKCGSMAVDLIKNAVSMPDSRKVLFFTIIPLTEPLETLCQ
ncbi:hypothetical protein [Simkania sp.]|uniref:hypothetical protein n=1 Tax=Simkania sp. TaxID=34094 RepID=UPI003B528F5E